MSYFIIAMVLLFLSFLFYFMQQPYKEATEKEYRPDYYTTILLLDLLSIGFGLIGLTVFFLSMLEC